MPARYVAPRFQADSFTCMYCHTLASMHWDQLHTISFGSSSQTVFWNCTCYGCKKISLWQADSIAFKATAGEMIQPSMITAAEAHQDLPENCRDDFEEARVICGQSPRGAAALLRLCLQKLLVHLGGAGKSIDADIKTLVAKGLDQQIQQALDVIRVTGNNAVHPLEMNLEDDHDSVVVLFDMINLIVDERISRPARLQARFNKLPQGARDAITRRDTPKT